jgi:hypothetical protein
VDVPDLPRFQHRLHIAVEFDEPASTIDGLTGIRRILHVARGTFVAGDDVTGMVVPGSGDWILERRDGSLELDIRFTLAPSGGKAVFMRSHGLFICARDVFARIRSGAGVSASDYYFRTSVLFETADARLLDLNRHIHIGIGTRTRTGMATDIFAVT